MAKNILISFLLLLWLGGQGRASVVAAPGTDLNTEKPKVVRTMERAKGQVTWIEGRTLNLLYDQQDDAEFEMLLPVDEKVQLLHYKKFSEIQRGDEVELEYEKVIEAPNTPEEKMTKSVKKIRFVRRPKEGELRSEEKGS